MNTQEYVAQKEQKELQELREYNKGLQDTVREMEKILANIQQKPSINDSRPCQKCVETEAILGAHK